MCLETKRERGGSVASDVGEKSEERFRRARTVYIAEFKKIRHKITFFLFFFLVRICFNYYYLLLRISNVIGQIKYSLLYMVSLSSGMLDETK